MKNFKFLAIALAFTLFISCGEDDVESITNDGTFTQTSEISVGFSDTNDGMLLLEAGGTVDFTITHSAFSLSADMVVSLGITSTDGSVEATFPAEVTIPAGSTSTDITVTLVDDGVAGDMETYTVSITDAVIQGDTTGFYITTAQASRTIDIVDTLPVIVVTTPSDVDFIFNWTGASDLDIRIRDAALNDIDTGYSVTPGETVTLPQSAPDGVYTLQERTWSIADPMVDWTIDFVHPDGTETFMGSLALSVGFWGEEFNLLEVEKVTDGATVTYTFTEL